MLGCFKGESKHRLTRVSIYTQSLNGKLSPLFLQGITIGG